MINPDTELDRLRWNLSGKAWTETEIDEIIGLVSEDINNVILDAVSNATSQAITHAEAIGAQDFIDDIDVIQEGSLYVITTKSGITDFTVQRVENLPNLLKNGKDMKGGGKYKVIPIREKRSRMGTSTFESMAQQDRDKQSARTALADDASSNRSARATTMAQQFRQNLAKTIESRKKALPQEVGTPQFRTATSNQDPKKDWVIPEIDRDMTQYLIDLNDRIRDTVQESVTTIISFYQQEYA